MTARMILQISLWGLSVLSSSQRPKPSAWTRDDVLPGGEWHFVDFRLWGVGSDLRNLIWCGVEWYGIVWYGIQKVDG
jgi:hypothetical protein